MWITDAVDSVKSLLAMGRYRYSRLPGAQATLSGRGAARASVFDNRRALKLSMVAMALAVALYLAVAFMWVLPLTPRVDIRI